MATIDGEDTLSEETLSILGHLNELRVRLTWAAGSLLVMTIVGFFVAEPFLNEILKPYGNQLQVLRPTEGIETFFLLAFTIGAILAMPMMVYQLWLFLSPGLTKSEKKYVYFFVPTTVLLFATGILFAWFILVPAAVSFLSNFQNDIFLVEWSGTEYISFILLMLFWLGVSFEMPVIAFFIGRFGIIQASALADQWRFAIVGIAILAAAITPSIDPITMLLTMAPLVVLYGLSIGTAWIGQRQFDRSMAIE